MRPEWHEMFLCETCRFKTPPINEIPLLPYERKDMFIGTLNNAERVGWRRYSRWWFCPECVEDGRYKKYCIEKEMEIVHYFGYMSREDVEKEWASV